MKQKMDKCVFLQKHVESRLSGVIATILSITTTALWRKHRLLAYHPYWENYRGADWRNYNVSDCGERQWRWV